MIGREKGKNQPVNPSKRYILRTQIGASGFLYHSSMTPTKTVCTLLPRDELPKIWKGRWETVSIGWQFGPRSLPVLLSSGRWTRIFHRARPTCTLWWIPFAISVGDAFHLGFPGWPRLPKKKDPAPPIQSSRRCPGQKSPTREWWSAWLSVVCVNVRFLFSPSTFVAAISQIARFPSTCSLRRALR